MKRHLLATGCLLALILPASGQDLSPEPASPPPQPEPYSIEIENLGESLLVAPAAEEAAVAEPVGMPIVETNGSTDQRGGKWRTMFHLDLSGSYNDNIFIQSENEVEDFVYEVAAGLTAGYWEDTRDFEDGFARDRIAAYRDSGVGNILVANYTAILLGFAETSSEDAYDQEAFVETRLAFGNVTLRGRSRFSSRSTPNIDVGNRLRQNTLETTISAEHAYSEKTTLEVAVSNRIYDYEGQSGAVESEIEGFVDYAWSPLVRVGLGVSAGYIDVENSENQVYERILSRARYALTDKIDVTGRAGVEFRQSDGPAGDRVNPVFALDVDYRATSTTRFGLKGYRRVENSAVDPDRNIIATGVKGELRQRIVYGFYFGLEGGYRRGDYTSVSDEPGREDDYIFLSPSIIYNFSSWGQVQLAYEYRNNDSSRPSSSFTNEILTLRASIVY